MYERLTPKEIARIKLEKRRNRIRHLRQVVATGAVTLVAVFSGVILTRSITDQSTKSQAAVVTASQPTTDDESTTSDPATSTSTPESAPTPTPVVTSQS